MTTKKQTKHHPGPWVKIRSIKPAGYNTTTPANYKTVVALDIYAADKTHICELRRVEGLEHTINPDANLIAAAPEMLEALKQAKNVLTLLWDEDIKFRKGVFAALSGQIYTAIKKAEEGGV